MASTNLFAPQVRMVQPAFVYDKDKMNQGEVKIYFSLSSYNNIDEVEGILLTFIDPNLASTWGTNSMIQESVAPAGYLKINFSEIEYNSNTNEYYFILNFTRLNFKSLTKNQYYQIQLYLTKIDLSKENITYTWLDSNKDNISAPSQASLIRPIEEPTLYLNGLSDKENINILQELNVLSGRIEYIEAESKKEIIKEYKYTIKDENENELYNSPQIINTLGLEFSTKINYYFKENVKYIIEFSYTTINGYNNSLENFSRSFLIKTDTIPDWTSFFLNSIRNEQESGSVELSFTINCNTLPIPGEIEIQRANEFTNFNNWISISTIDIKSKTSQENSSQITFNTNDYTVEGGVKCAYRFVYKQNNQMKFLSKNYYHIAEYEDIFLSDKDILMGVKYNPNITGFKWVTQEAITNTLGGVYPIIRKNGQTKYKQFTLTGTLFFNVDEYISSESYDSAGKIMNSFINNQETSLFFSQEKTFEYITGNQKQSIIEKRMRDFAMEFLTNGQPKLFRSFEEGNMIVYLSNISFTPNKTLSRHVYDFSCTVTEICEATEENLMKFNFATIVKKYIYVLNALKTEEFIDDNIKVLRVYVSANEIVKSSALRLRQKAVILNGEI